MKIIFLFASVAVASGLLFVNIYTSIIDAKSWGSDIPNSIETARLYYKTVNPGHFFRIFSPVNQLLALLVVIVCWKTAPGLRIYTSIALVLYMCAEALTFGYFYPRNAVMFSTASLTDTVLLQKTWAEWNTMNWIRSALLLAGIFFSFFSLHQLYPKNLEGLPGGSAALQASQV